MLKRIWQWLKALFRRLFGGEPPRGERLSRRENGLSTNEDSPTPRPLDDSDCEYLFRQLLEGVAHSWQQDRIVRWFEGLKGRITYAEWVGWLRRFGERVLASPSPNNELATRLVLLGEQILYVPSLQEIGQVTYDIGSQLLSREPSGAIWEYEGPDAGATAPSPFLTSADQGGEFTTPLSPADQGGEFTTPLSPPDQGGEATQPEDAPVEAITLDELFARMQQDPNLVQVIAQQFGIDTTDPQVIIQEVINQLNAANQSAIDEALDWFNQGNQQNEAGNFAGAIASYDKVLEIRPDLFEGWFNRGNALSNLGQFEEAIASYDKAIELNPDLQEAWHNRANALFNLGRLDEAKASLEKAQEIKGS